MLLLTFQIAGELYAVDASCVVEVVPRIKLRPVPHAPDHFAGVFHYRGAIVPTIDLARLIGSGASVELLSTRIILARVSDPAEATPLVGLIAEGVSDVRKLADDAMRFPGLGLRNSAYLGPVVELGEDLVQLILVDKILSETLRDAAVAAAEEEG